jgi:2'-5' RNA ligase
MSLRLFVALDLPEEVRAALPSPDPAAGWRAVPRGSLHVTLAFLGWMEPPAAERVCPVVASAVRSVGPLTLAGVVLLPPRRPRVMAVRLEGDVGECQASVSAALAGAGLYEPEARPFLPHVTIGRARGPVARGPLDEVPALTFQPPSLTVYRSRPARGGARYEALCTFAL